MSRRRVATFQVIADDAAHDLTLFGIRIETQEAFCEFDALRAVVAGARLPVSCIRRARKKEVRRSISGSAWRNVSPSHARAGAGRALSMTEGVLVDGVAW